MNDDYVKCPNCNKITRNIAISKEVKSPIPNFMAVAIGFQCEHCKFEWGFE
jgi:C4-type Zn-finger protein